MCGCQIPLSAETFISGDALLNNEMTRQTLAGRTFLSKEDFMRRDMLTLLRFAYCADAQAVRDAFENVGIAISQTDPDSDLQILAKMHQTGEDVKDPKGPFSVSKVFSSINIRTANLSSCSVQFV